ncbi:MAG: HAD-IA family hydrolase, partial [Chloroflexota bacterium]
EAALTAAWEQLFERYGHPFPMEKWLPNIGRMNVYHPGAHLVELTGLDKTEMEFREERRQLGLEILADDGPMPGVLDRIKEAKEMGLKLGIASTSEARWLNYHLPRLGLLYEFEAVRGRSDVGGVGKPEPDVYLSACKGLRVDPKNALALEDSVNGVIAGKRAGMKVVAIPNPLTRHMDYSDADLILYSMADMTLAEMIEKVVG